MQKKSLNAIMPINAKRLISCFMAIAVILCSFPCIAMAEEGNVVTQYTDANAGVDFELLKEGNNIYFGAYRHATGMETKTETVNSVSTTKTEPTYEISHTPILWKIAQVTPLPTESPDEYKLTLMSAHILDYTIASKADEFASDFISSTTVIEPDLNPVTVPNANTHFSAFEQKLLKNNTFSLINKAASYFPKETTTAKKNERKTTLKNSTSGVEYLVKDNADLTKYYPVSTSGVIGDTINTVTGTEATKLYGIRLTVELTVTAADIVQLSEITTAADGYSAGTSTSKNLKFTFIDSDTEYATNADSANAKLSLSSVTYNKYIYNDKTDKWEPSNNSTDAHNQTDTKIEIEASKSLSITATSNHKFAGSIGGSTDYSINYKIVSSNGKIVGSGKVLNNPIAGENTMSIPTKKSFSGEYIVHMWLQKNEKVNSHVTSEPVYFNIKVNPKEGTTPTENDISGKDFVIAVDYYNEVIRLVGADTESGSVKKYEGKDYIEIASEEDSKTIASEAESYYYNYGSKVGFMYAVKAVSDSALSSLNAEKKADKLFAEKWYPIYGNTIDIAKVMPKKSVPVGDKKGYYVAIRKADDKFVVGQGYESRKTVMLRGRASEANLKKSIEYDAENEQYIFNGAKMSGNSVYVRYRFNYFSAFENAMLYKSGATTEGDTSPNIKIPSELFSSGGTLFISLMPKAASGYAVETAASKELKITIPKKANAPTVKFDEKGKKLTGLKKNSTMQYKTESGTWEPYAGSLTSVDISTLKTTFPNIYLDYIEDENKEKEDFVVYFRTKAVSKKSPASMVAEVTIPGEFAP